MPTNFCRRRWSTASLLATIFICFNSPAAQTSRMSENVTVVIDAGHGGHDRGGIPGQRISEEHMTLDVRHRAYYVLRKTKIPAVLVECGFLTNPTEGAYAQTASYRQKLAEEIAAGVRGRNSVGGALSTTRVATSETVPLQPYIDQTKVSTSEHRKSKRSHKKSARKKKTSSKSTGSEARYASTDPEA